MKHYVIAIAGNVIKGSPTSVDVTQVSEEFWPIWEQAFGGSIPEWWYVPAVDAIPMMEAALENMEPARQKKVLQRVLSAMKLYPDSSVAWGVEEDIEEVWVDELPAEEE